MKIKQKKEDKMDKLNQLNILFHKEVMLIRVLMVDGHHYMMQHIKDMYL